MQEFQRELYTESFRAKTFFSVCITEFLPNFFRNSSEIAKNLSVSSRTIENEIKHLRETGYIERQGATKDGEWIIKNIQ